MHLTRLRKKPVVKQYMSKNLSTKFFTYSMILILIVGIGFFIALHFFMSPKQNLLTSLNYQPVTTLPVSLALNLSSPDDNILVFDPNLLISGKTSANILILITVNDVNQIINSSNQGDFSLTFKLQPGNNQLIVSAFDSLGNYKAEERSIYYSEEKI